ncbi:MAG: glutaredoxin domain-containing protein [Tangfeifania sp.]
MKTISNFSGLKKEIESNENVWLLLYKKGSSQSDCAIENFKKAEVKVLEKGKNNVLCSADVNEVTDIHPEFSITSVPALLHFEKGQLKNTVKGCHQPEQFNVIFEKAAFVVSANGDEKPQKNVTVYTTPTCTWCNTIKRHLQENRIQFREVDVSVNQKAAEEMVRKSGQQGVPQTDINGEIIVGFDKSRINRLLGIN